MTLSVLPATTSGIFACPECLAQPLIASEHRLTCKSCSQAYAITDGVPVFRKQGAEFDWGAPPQRMIQALEEAEQIGWHDAFMRLLSSLSRKEAELLWLRSFGNRRAALQMLLPISPDSRVLDLGCGWGAISLHLAAHCKEVVAFDQIGLHLRWLKASSRANEVKNITFVQGGDTHHLPFPDASFDAVILNGVLEHIAVNTTGDPRDVQRRVLSDIGRILKPGAPVYVGIENRLNYKYFLGVREGHISMKYGALLPRFATRWFLKWRRNRPFREYTYSLFGYRKLLTQAGFPHQRYFAPWPTYSSAGEFFPVEETVSTPHWKVKSLHPAAQWPGHFFARAYSICASREPARASLVERVLKEIAERLERPLPWPLEHCVFKASSGGKATLLARHPGKAWHIQVGLTPLASQRIRSQYTALAALHQTETVPEAVKKSLPTPLLAGQVDGYGYGVRSLASGQSGGKFIASRKDRIELCRKAGTFLLALQSAGARRITVDSAEFDRFFAAPIGKLRGWFTAQEWSRLEPWFAERVDWLKRQFLGVDLPLVPFHGDFTPENCVWDRTTDHLTVMDWELYDPSGLPLLDWITFLGDAHRPQVKADIRARGDDPDRMKFHGYPFIFLGGPLKDDLQRYLQALDISPNVLPGLVFMWWVKQLHDWAALLLYHPDWRTLRVFPIIERWNRATDTGEAG